MELQVRVFDGNGTDNDELNDLIHNPYGTPTNLNGVDLSNNELLAQQRELERYERENKGKKDYDGHYQLSLDLESDFYSISNNNNGANSTLTTATTTTVSNQTNNNFSALNYDFLQSDSEIDSNVDALNTRFNELSLEESTANLFDSNDDLSKVGPPKSKITKIFNRKNISSCKVKDMILRISALNKKIMQIEYESQKIFEGLWWRNCDNVKDRITKWCDQNEGHITTLAVDQSVELRHLWNRVPVIPENHLMPTLIKDLQNLEITFHLLLQRCTRMKLLMQGTHFRSTLEWYKKMVDDCLVAISEKQDGDKITKLLELYNSLKQDITTQGNVQKTYANELRRECKNFHKEAVCFLVQAIGLIESKQIDLGNKKSEWDQMKLYLLGDNTLEENQDKNKGLKTKLEKEIDQLGLQFTIEKRVIVSDNELEVLRSKGTLRGSYYVNPGWGGYFADAIWSGAGYYAEAYKESEKMQKTAQAILGLDAEITKSLEALTNASLLESKKYDECFGYYSTLTSELTTAIGSLFSGECNQKVKEVANYAAGLSEKLNDIRSSLDLLFRFVHNDQITLLLQAQSTLCLFLNPADISTNPDAKSLDAVEKLYFAASKFAEFKDLGKHKETRLDTFIDSYMQKTTGMINETLAGKKGAVLEYTDKENEVWDIVTGLRSFDSLYYMGEDEEGLPTVVRSYLEKRIVKLMHFSEAGYDQKIEMLLFLLTQDVYNKKYMHSLSTHVPFSQIHKAYMDLETTNQEHQRDPVLFAMKEVFGLICKAKTERDSMAYGEAWYKLLKVYFTNNGYMVGIVPSTASLLKIAYTQLQRIVKAHSYVPISEMVGISFTMDNCNARPLSDFSLSMWSSYTVQESRGLLYRALSTCIWSKEGESEEEEELRVAHEIVRQVMTGGKFSECLESNQGDFLKLIYENSISKILTKGVKALNEVELKLLLEGPINDFLSGHYLGVEDPGIIYVLDELVASEEENTIAKMKEAMGEEKFEKIWKMRSFQLRQAQARRGDAPKKKMYTEELEEDLHHTDGQNLIVLDSPTNIGKEKDKDIIDEI